MTTANILVLIGRDAEVDALRHSNAELREMLSEMYAYNSFFFFSFPSILTECVMAKGGLRWQSCLFFFAIFDSMLGATCCVHILDGAMWMEFNRLGECR